MALSCAAFRRDSVSLLRLPFLGHVQVLSCEIEFISRLSGHRVVVFFHFCFLVIVILSSVVLLVSFLMTVVRLLLLLYTLLEFFTSALTDGFTLEFE